MRYVVSLLRCRACNGDVSERLANLSEARELLSVVLTHLVYGRQTNSLSPSYVENTDMEETHCTAPSAETT